MNLKTPNKNALNFEIKNKLIITAASQVYGKSVLALLGSLTLNWPGHPPVLVYDLGMDEETLAVLMINNIEVRKVPPFVPHWRKHFTWKIWCMNDAPARDIFWIDAGVAVLQPLDDVFSAIDRLGYFILPTYWLLTDNATEAACVGCGVDSEFRNGKITFSGGMIGFRKEGITNTIVSEALKVASVEEYIMSTIPFGRHDQAILSLLIYKYISNPIMLDGMVYSGWESPRQVVGQKAWVHRRGLFQDDVRHFINHISTPGKPYFPQTPLSLTKRNIFIKFMITSAKKIINKFYFLFTGNIIYTSVESYIYDGVRDK